MDRTSQRLRLEDGRTLGFAEYGCPDGLPVIYFHGWPSSRLEAGPMHEICLQLGVRMIAADRPGMGLSDFQSGRTFLDFTADVEQLAEHLGLQHFGALGISGGGPYALACAWKLPARVTTTLLVCSVGPCDAPNATKDMVAMNRLLLGMAKRFPRLARGIAGLCLWGIWGRGEQPVPRQIEARLPEADRQALQSPELRLALTASSTEALRSGVRGAAADGLLYGRNWGFSPAEIRAPVFLWHGEKDVIVPAAMGHYLADLIPACRAQFYPQDGHFSLPFTRLREILMIAVR